MNVADASKKRPLENAIDFAVNENVEGDTAPSAANKEGSQVNPTVAPSEPRKKRVKRIRVTVSHPNVSQKTVEDEMKITTPLAVSSQQETPIKIGLSPKASCKESAQTHDFTHEEPPLAETHTELGHSEEPLFDFDAPPFFSVEQPIIPSEPFTPLFSTTPNVFSISPREGGSPNPSGVDHSSFVMNEPPFSGPQEPISQSEMDTTTSNTELEQDVNLSERETASTLFELHKASYLREVAVTASAVVKDTPIVAVTIDAIKVVVTSIIDNNLSAQDAVTSPQRLIWTQLLLRMIQMMMYPSILF
ncbi:hypothetical protein OROMI_013697 [Orobanche minor]